MTPNEAKQNEIMDFLGKQKVHSEIYPNDFKIGYHEFKSHINKMEDMEYINKGRWFHSDNLYIFNGLTFDGRNFLQNNDKKQDSKIKNKEVTYNNYVNIYGTNYGNAICGNGNTIQSPLDQKITELIEAISKSQLSDKEQIIEELQYSRTDKVSIQQILGKLLTRGAEICGIATMVKEVLILCL